MNTQNQPDFVAHNKCRMEDMENKSACLLIRECNMNLQLEEERCKESSIVIKEKDTQAGALIRNGISVQTQPDE